MRGKSILLAVVMGMLIAGLAFANPPRDKTPIPFKGEIKHPLDTPSAQMAARLHKFIDRPNPKDLQRIRLRQKVLNQLRAPYHSKAETLSLQNEAASLALTTTDRVLVILVEFGGSDTFTWHVGDTWDPFGIADTSGSTGTARDCSAIITADQEFTYTGPLHNQIARPVSAADASGNMIWTEDFNPAYYEDIISGGGIILDYNRVDGSHVHEDFTGKSVNDYYQDMSGGSYAIVADVKGWVQVPHSTWWYGADECPGAQSGLSVADDGAIPGAGSARSLVIDALEAVKAANPSMDWSQYDQDGDGVIDRLWIIHAGFGEEDMPTLLNRTNYGEAAIWSHSSSLPTPYQIVPGISAGPYIMMPENCGIGVLAHEYGHNLGTDDLYSYGMGETSAGFWTLMADDWTGYPIGFEPPALDPWHLDNLGWLHPFVVSDPTQTYTVTVGQASGFPGGDGVYRGVRINLEDGHTPLPISPLGTHYWFGGRGDELNSMMVTKSPIAIPAGGATLSFDLAYGIETEWDFLWVQVSTDSGASWKTLTNANTTCSHASGWIGAAYGFPEDLCAAGIAGFTGYNGAFPGYTTQSFDLNTFAAQNVLLRFWYMTDWGSSYEGPFIDNVQVASGASTLFSDNAESGGGNWNYFDQFQWNDGTVVFTHNYYLQWRNVSSSGGYDSALADSRWRFGPANTGLLVWYNNNYYTDNEIGNYLTDFPGFGPKGRMLVVDSHPEPYRDPYYKTHGYDNEGGNLLHRGLMRDAPFSLDNSVPFSLAPPYVVEDSDFPGRPPVNLFDDSVGTYCGAEFVSRGPGFPTSTAYRWVTEQWDASVVLPSKEFYGIKAPEYSGGSGSVLNEFRYACSRYGNGLLGCYYLGNVTGLGYNGSEGNPRDIGGEYGWRVQILSQTESTATLKIWNANIAPGMVVRSGKAGLWLLKDGSLSNIQKASPARIAPFGHSLAAYFPGKGLYLYDGVNWGEPISRRGGLQNMVEAHGKLYVDYGLKGLWKYDGAWSRISRSNTQRLAVHDNKLVVLFNGNRLYEYDGTTWTLIGKRPVQGMSSVDNDLYVDCGKSGLYKYDGVWTPIGTNPSKIYAYGTGVMASFPGGELRKYNSAGWTVIAEGTVQNMVAISGTLYVDLGRSGLYKYDGTWSRIHESDPLVMAAYGDKLVVKFAGGDMSQYDGSNWTSVGSLPAASQMVGVYFDRNH